MRYNYIFWLNKITSMNSPKVIRRKSKVCYKEDDSFIDEFNYTISPKTPSRTKPRQSIVKTNTASKESNSDSETPVTAKSELIEGLIEKRKSPSICMSEESASSSTDPKSTELVDLRKKSSWNPKVRLEEVNHTDVVKRYNDSPALDSPSVRRGTRMRIKTSIAKQSEESCKLFKKLSVDERSDSDSNDSEQQLLEKPSTLFSGEDVEGKQMFRFKVMHRKQDMVKKAIESILDSPKLPRTEELSRTPRTPKSSQKSNVGTPSRRGRKSALFNTPKSIKQTAYEKTPHHIRNKIKKKLETMANEDSEGTDFEDSGSDYQVSNESQSSDDAPSESDGDKSDSSDSEALKKVQTKILARQVQTPSKPYGLRKPRGDKDSKFIVKSDDYFSMHGSKKVITSNHTLERLKTPRLTEDKLQHILKQQKMSAEHCRAIKELMEDHQKLFDKWMYILSEGYTILLHGVGSKQKLIKDFQLQKLSNYPCIVINGFFPSLALKDVLESIISDLLDINSVPSNIYEAVKLIEEEMTVCSSTNLFLLIHNIDGTMLRNNKTQNALSKLAKIKNIYMIVSVDFINAPLIWDHSILSNFNFSWWDVTTLLPYTQETSFESSLMVHNSGALALSSLRNVFQSLTTNARGIFMIIVKNQIKNKKTPHYQGISFKDLYWSARESFLVSSDLALRAQLTEFLDHKLVKTRRTVDGIENLIIPIDSLLLQQFLEQNE